LPLSRPIPFHAVRARGGAFEMNPWSFFRELAGRACPLGVEAALASHYGAAFSLDEDAMFQAGVGFSYARSAVVGTSFVDLVYRML